MALFIPCRLSHAIFATYSKPAKLFIGCAPTKASVYSKRDGAITGLALLSSKPRNLFRQSKGWKTGVVHGVQMLPRSDMVKPEKAGVCKPNHTFPLFYYPVFDLSFPLSPGGLATTRKQFATPWTCFYRHPRDEAGSMAKLLVPWNLIWSNASFLQLR